MDWLIQYLTLDRCLDALGFIVGILYLWWEYFANPKMWIAELIMPVIMCWLFFDKGLYADFGMNLYYFLIAIYGYVIWTRGNRKSKSARSASATPINGKTEPDNAGAKASENGTKSAKLITHISPKALAGCVGALIVVYALIAYWLVNFTDSTVPYIDAFTTSASIVAMWMLARKYIEQWIAWILVDAVSAGLYLYKDIPLSSLRYAIYTAIAFFGYAKWLRLMRAQQSA